jgi:hypothetical protein
MFLAASFVCAGMGVRAFYGYRTLRERAQFLDELPRVSSDTDMNDSNGAPVLVSGELNGNLELQHKTLLELRFRELMNVLPTHIPVGDVSLRVGHRNVEQSFALANLESLKPWMKVGSVKSSFHSFHLALIVIGIFYVSDV